MHSRIFQLEKQPISEDDYIYEEKYYDNFVGEIADYVSSDTDRKQDIKWLLDYIKEYGIKYNSKQNSIKFLKGFKEKYFENRFEKFKKLVNDIDLRKFSSDNMDIYNLTCLIEDKFSFYVDGEYDGLNSIDDFVRGLNENETYYIGGTIDYHC